MEKKTNKIELANQDLLKKNLICTYILIFLVSLNLVFTVVNQSSSTEEKGIGYDISEFKTITSNNLENELNIKEEVVLLIGKESCVYTEKLIPVLQEAQEKYGYKTLYLDFDKFTDEDKENILKYDDDTKVLEENYGSTPMVITFRDKKMVDVWIGYESFEKFSAFLDESGFDKK